MANYDFDVLRAELAEITSGIQDYTYGIHSLAFFINDAIYTAESLYGRVGDSTRVEVMVDKVYVDLAVLRARVTAANS